MTTSAPGRGLAEPAPRRSVLRRPLVWASVLAMLVGGGVVVSAWRSQPVVGSLKAGPELPVTPMDQAVGPSNNSPVILADPSEPRFVVLANRLDAPDFSCALQVSGDGGSSWAPVNPIPKLPEGADKCYAPEVAFDRQGTLFYLFVGLAGGGNRPMGVFLTTSTDQGRTFGPPRQVLGKLSFTVRMAMDPGMGRQGRLHLVWLEARSEVGLGGFGPPPNPILSKHSDDGGATFSDPVQVSDPGRPRVVATALTLGPDHRVHVAYLDLGADARDYQGLEGPVWEDPWTLVLASSTDGGRSFSAGVVVDDGIVPTERVMLIFTMAPPALVADGDRVCLGWSDGRRGDPDVFVQCLPHGRPPLGEPRRVNDDPEGNGRWQYLPRISLAPDGRLDAVFFDRRNSPQNFVNEVFYAYSTDGGNRFSPNLMLTADGSDSRIGQQYTNVSARGQVEIGGRLGLLSRPDDVIAAWPDTRNSRSDTTGQDLFLTRIQLPYRRPSSGVAVGGGLLIVAGLAGLFLVARRRPDEEIVEP